MLPLCGPVKWSPNSHLCRLKSSPREIRPSTFPAHTGCERGVTAGPHSSSRTPSFVRRALVHLVSDTERRAGNGEKSDVQKVLGGKSVPTGEASQGLGGMATKDSILTEPEPRGGPRQHRPVWLLGSGAEIEPEAPAPRPMSFFVYKPFSTGF